MGTQSFDEGFFLAVRAIQVLLTKNQRIVVVGVAGPSGAGKTSLAQRITEVIPGSVYATPTCSPVVKAGVCMGGGGGGGRSVGCWLTHRRRWGTAGFCPWTTIWTPPAA